MKAICKGPECTKYAIAKGLCNTHWAQMSRRGALSPILTEDTPERRFWRYVRKDTETGCWNWFGAGCGKGYDRETGQGGYGQLRIGGQSWQAHRWSYEYYLGVVLTSEDTLDHLCRNTRCSNPEHLEVVGRGENTHRRNLYKQLESENQRFRNFISSLGYNPDVVLGGEYNPNFSSL